MIINKILKNQILKIVKEVIGLNDNKWELRKIENDLRTLQGNMATMQNMIDSKLKNVCTKCKCKVKEKSG